MTDLLLYGHPDSGHACKVALALALSGLPHRTVYVDIWAPRDTRPPAFRAISPLGEVPVLDLDGAAFFQSGAILMELATRFEVLGGTRDMPRAREIILWEANRIGLCLPQLVEARRAGSDGLPPDVIAWLEARFAVDSRNFETLLGDGPFFHGAAPGIADCAVWGYVQWLGAAGVTGTAAQERWRAAMRGLPQMRAPEAWFPNT